MIRERTATPAREPAESSARRGGRARGGWLRRLAWRLFVGLDAALVFAFAAGYLAAYVHPRYFWWAEFFAIGLPYLALLLVLPTVVAGLARRRRLLAFHLALLVVAALRLVPFPQLLSRPAPSPDDLQLMSYNVPTKGGRNAETKAAGMLRLMRDVEPHLVALQEANVAFQLDPPAEPRYMPYIRVLVDSLGYFVRQPEPGAASWVRTKQPVLSRLPVHDVFLRSIYTAGGGAGTEVVRARFRWQDRDAVLYNLYLHSYGSPKPWDEAPERWLDLDVWLAYVRRFRDRTLVRAEEVARIREMIDAEELPVVLCGDFNSTPHSWAYRQLAQGRRDVFRYGGNGWGATYHTRLPFARIDFILADPAWTVVSSRVLDDGPLSDHQPLLARLRWRE